MIHIGIDTGVNTGIAIWDDQQRRLLYINTLSITKAIDVVMDHIKSNHQGCATMITVYIEDARKRKFFGKSGREKLQGVGSVKRDASIWETFCKEQCVEYILVAPRNNMTKLSPSQFQHITGWAGRLSEHARDATMLVFGR